MMVPICGTDSQNGSIRKVTSKVSDHILSMVAPLYDPLGFVAPFPFTRKIVLQEMCRHGVGWDDPLFSELQPVWECSKNDLANLEKINIPHYYVPPALS